MASAVEHKAIFNMPSELGVEISFRSAHQISKFVNIFLYRIVFMLENTQLFYVPIHPLNGPGWQGHPTSIFGKYLFGRRFEI